VDVLGSGELIVVIRFSFSSALTFSNAIIWDFKEFLCFCFLVGFKVCIIMYVMIVLNLVDWRCNRRD
jgi:hypothetical protein